MYLVPLNFHGTRNLNVTIFEVCGYANFLIAAMWNDEHSAALVGWESLLFIRVDQLAVEGTPYIGPIHPAKIYSHSTCDEGHHYQCCSTLDTLLFSLHFFFGQTWRTVPAVLQSCVGRCLHQLSFCPWPALAWLSGFVLARLSDAKRDDKLIVLISSNGIDSLSQIHCDIVSS